MTKVVFPNVVAPKRSIPCHQAPIEGKTKVYPYRLLRAIAHFIENGDPSLFENYTTLQIGKQGVLCFSNSCYEDFSVILWSRQLDLRRGRTALLVPSREGENLILSAFDPDCRKHLGTFYYDREAKSFYALTAKSNSTFKEYFAQIDANQRFVFRNTPYCLSDVAEKGDIVRLVEQGEKMGYRTTRDSTWKPLTPALRPFSTQHHKESKPDTLEIKPCSEKDRRTINDHIRSGDAPKPIELKSPPVSGSRRGVETALAKIVYGYSKPLKLMVAELAIFFENRETSSQDIAYAIGFIYFLAMKEDKDISEHALEVFANLHKALAAVARPAWPKLTQGLIFALRSTEGKQAAITAVRNGLSGEEPEKILALLRSNKNLADLLRLAMNPISAE